MIQEETFSFNELQADIVFIGQLEKIILPEYLKKTRWFGGKARKLSELNIDKWLHITEGEKRFHLLIIKAKYTTGKSEDYLLPIALALSTEGISEKGIICQCPGGWLIDAIYDEDFRKALFHHLFYSSKIKQPNGSLFFEKGSGFVAGAVGEDANRGRENPNRARENPDRENEVAGFTTERIHEFSSRVLDADQSNSSIIYERAALPPPGGDTEGGGGGAGYFLKIYRKLFRETNPDVEVVKFLTEKAHFIRIPAFAGSFSWKKAYGSPITLGMMQQKVSAIKDAWSLAGDYLNEFLFGLAGDHEGIPSASIEQAALLGLRTAELHIALASDPTESAFSPETFTEEYREWLFDNCESLLKKRIRLAKDCYSSLDEDGKSLAKFFFNQQYTIREFFAHIKTQHFESARIRIHGDYHLGQILYDGHDYIILDFEGEPESSIRDRKIKHSALKDVAGMLRSFHYAVSAKLYFSSETHNLPKEKIEDAIAGWYAAVTKNYLDAYRKKMDQGAILRAGEKELEYLLQFHLLEKAVYELGYELNARPHWVKIPLRGIRHVIENASSWKNSSV